MGDDEHGALSPEACERAEHALLRRRIERRGGLVEQKHRQTRGERTRDGDPLPLSARHLAMRRERRVAERRRERLRPEPCEHRLLVDAFGRSEENVRGQGVAEDRRVLGDPCERTLARPHAVLRELGVAPPNAARRERIEAEQRAEERGLADPGRSHDRDDAPRRRVERQWGVRAVGRHDVAHDERSELPGLLRRFGRRRGRCGTRRRGERLFATRPREATLDDLAERLVRHEKRDRERHDPAAIDAADHAARYEEKHEDERERAEHLARAREQRRARSEPRRGRDEHPPEARDVIAHARLRAVRGPEIRMAHRFVGRAEQGLRFERGAGMILLESATRDHDDHRESAHRERRAPGETRREQDEEHRERRERQRSPRLGKDAQRYASLHVRHVARERREVGDLRTDVIAAPRKLCRTLIPMSRRARGEHPSEHLETKRRADLSRDARFSPSRHHSTDELRQCCKKPDSGEAEHRDGSDVHRARAPGERTRERAPRRRERRVASGVQDRAGHDDDPERRPQENRSCGARVKR